MACADTIPSRTDSDPSGQYIDSAHGCGALKFRMLPRGHRRARLAVLPRRARYRSPQVGPISYIIEMRIYNR